MPDLLAWLPAGVLATIVLSASSVLLGVGLPLGSGLAILGLVRGFVENRWREFVLGVLLVVGLVGAGVFLRVWGAGLVTGEELGAANATAAFVFALPSPDDSSRARALKLNSAPSISRIPSITIRWSTFLTSSV